MYFSLPDALKGVLKCVPALHSSISTVRPVALRN